MRFGRRTHGGTNREPWVAGGEPVTVVQGKRPSVAGYPFSGVLMKTKGQRQAKERRRVRRKEKDSAVKNDAMLGRVCRRKWGAGKAK